MQVEAVILFEFSTFTFWIVKKKSISNNEKPTEAIRAHIRMAETHDFSASCQAASQRNNTTINLSSYLSVSINQPKYN